MATLETDEDRLFADSMDRWRQTAISEIGDIEADILARQRGEWHSAPAKLPNHFYPDTGFLVAWVARKLPALSPAPIQSIYDAIKAWHDGRRPPDYDSLSRLMDQAIIVVDAAWAEVYSRRSNSQISPTDARNQFCYEEWQRGQSLMQIFIALKKHPEWEQVGDEKAVRGPIKSWAKKHELPVRVGERGKPKSAKRG